MQTKLGEFGDVGNLVEPSMIELDTTLEQALAACVEHNLRQILRCNYERARAYLWDRPGHIEVVLSAGRPSATAFVSLGALVDEFADGARGSFYRHGPEQADVKALLRHADWFEEEAKRIRGMVENWK